MSQLTSQTHQRARHATQWPHQQSRLRECGILCALQEFVLGATTKAIVMVMFVMSVVVVVVVIGIVMDTI
ncbi:hypothetical protein N9L68_03840 [bacterium]|nr:hypothetical protein [bacterium]